MNRHVNLPFTEEGKKLNMTNELFEVCKVVYQKVPSNNDETSDNTVNDYRFKSLYNPDIDYSDDCIIVPFQSVFLKIELWKKGDIFCNVIGSSDDKGHYDDEKTKKIPWNILLENELKKIHQNLDWSCQAEKDNFYISYNDILATGESKYSCNDNPDISTTVVGGHVIKEEKTPRQLCEGSQVYIIPICKHHNSVAVPDENGQTHGNGSGFYMKTRKESFVLVMTGYIPKKRIGELNG